MHNSLKLFTFFAATFFLAPLFAQTSAYLDSLIEKANTKKLYQNHQWQLILQLNDGNPSIKNAAFYLGLDNKKIASFSLQKELIATLVAFYNTEKLADSAAICRFPARLNWLKQQLDLKNLPQARCRKYKEFLTKVNPTKASLVIASEDLTNPTSMMGHIFLQLDGTYQKKPVSHVLSYVTILGNDIFSIVYKSMISGGVGIMSLYPTEAIFEDYLIKQERNIWQYPLDINLKQVQLIANLAWEMKDIDAGYNFIFHNCGTILWNILKTAIPKLQNEKPKLWISPLEYTKLLYDKKVLQEDKIKISLSLKYKIKTLHLLDKNPQKTKELIEFTISPAQIHFPNEDAKLISQTLASAIVDYKFYKNDINETELKTFYSKLAPYTTKKPAALDFSNFKNPIHSNPGSKIKLELFNQAGNKTKGLTLGFMPVQTFLQESHKEYFDDFELKMGYFEVALEQKNKNNQKLTSAKFSKIDLLKVINLPTNYYTNSLSFIARLGLQDEYDVNLNPYSAWGAEMNFGYSFNLATDVLFYSLLGTQYHFGSNKNLQQLNNAKTGLINKTSSQEDNFLLKINLGLIVKEVWNMKTLINLANNYNLTKAFDYYDLKITQSMSINRNLNLDIYYSNQFKASRFNSKNDFNNDFAFKYNRDLNTKNTTLGANLIFSF